MTPEQERDRRIQLIKNAFIKAGNKSLSNGKTGLAILRNKLVDESVKRFGCSSRVINEYLEELIKLKYIWEVWDDVEKDYLMNIYNNKKEPVQESLYF